MKKKILFNGVLYEESDNAKTGYEVDTDTQSHFWYIDHTLNSHRGCRDNIPETIDSLSIILLDSLKSYSISL